MCYRVHNGKIDLYEAADQLRAEYSGAEYAIGGDINAFSKPVLPVVVEKDGRIITEAIWKLNPPKPGEPPTKGLNLQAENSWNYYKAIQHNRCVVPVTAFFEWKHYPVEGKKDVTALHKLTWQGLSQFYMAAYYNVWEDGTIGFGLVTCPGNELLSSVHNVQYHDPKRKNQRMPISFDAKMAVKFLEDERIEEFMYPNFDPQLIAENLEPQKVPQQGLF